MLLNVYDLSPANDYLFQVGLGLHHSGVEISGREYSFGSGGGIFESPPKVAPGARFRVQLDLGAYDGGSKELNKALDDLRSEGFGNRDYNLVKRNCNHFSNALSLKLLQRPIPPHINRLADIGNCCSCLLPKELIGDSPVGGSGEGGGDQSFIVPTRSSMNRGGNTMDASAFSGKGRSLGSSGSSNTSQTSGFLSQWSSSGSASKPPSDDLTDRREKARLAAMARMERSQQQGQGKQS